MAKKTFTVKEAAKRLNVTPQAITSWIRTGKKLGPKFYSDPEYSKGWKYIIDNADLKAYESLLKKLSSIGA